MLKLNRQTKKIILNFQKNEITEYFIYQRLSQSIKDPHNKEVLRRISEDELKHYEIWKELSHEDVGPSKFMIWKYFIISKILGVTFGLKLMEMGEEKAQLKYGQIVKVLPGTESILEDEESHENELIDLLDEERLKYVGSVVLGLNDALVELTGALAGFTLALQNTRLIAMVGLITGIAASLSMAASEYLSTKTEGNGKNPLKSSLYTGSAYVLTVTFLILPYLLFSNVYLCLGLAMTVAVVIIFMFTYYVSVTREIPLAVRFFEMAGISLGVATVSFFIGYAIRIFFSI